MAFSAQGGMFPQQLQALVNVNPGAQLTLQQTGNSVTREFLTLTLLEPKVQKRLVFAASIEPGQPAHQCSLTSHHTVG